MLTREPANHHKHLKTLSLTDHKCWPGFVLFFTLFVNFFQGVNRYLSRSTHCLNKEVLLEGTSGNKRVTTAQAIKCGFRDQGHENSKHQRGQTITITSKTIPNIVSLLRI